MVQTQQAVQAAQQAFDAAKEMQRLAVSTDGAQAREVARAQLGEQVATGAAVIDRLQAQQARALAMFDAAAAAATARDRLQQLGTSLKARQAALESATATLSQKQDDEALADSVSAFARWSDARAKQGAAASARDEAKALRSSAFAKESEARQLETRAEGEEGQRRGLPTDAQCQHVRELHRLLELREGGAERCVPGDGAAEQRHFLAGHSRRARRPR